VIRRCRHARGLLASPGMRVSIDLESCSLRLGDARVSFSIAPLRSRCCSRRVDELGSCCADDAIARTRRRRMRAADRAPARRRDRPRGHGAGCACADRRRRAVRPFLSPARAAGGRHRHRSDRRLLCRRYGRAAAGGGRRAPPPVVAALGPSSPVRPEAVARVFRRALPCSRTRPGRRAHPAVGRCSAASSPRAARRDVADSLREADRRHLLRREAPRSPTGPKDPCCTRR